MSAPPRALIAGSAPTNARPSACVQAFVMRHGMIRRRLRLPPDSSTFRATGASNPVDSHTCAYQCGAQMPSLSRGPLANAACGREVDPEPVAQGAQMAFRISQEIPASMIGGATPAALSSSYSATCCGRPMSSAVTGGARLDVGRHHLARVADQQHVAQLRDPAVVDVRQQVVGHVLLVPDRRAAGRGAEQGVDDAAASRCRRRR